MDMQASEFHRFALHAGLVYTLSRGSMYSFSPGLKHGAYSVRIAQEFPNSIGATKQQIFLLELKQLETWPE